MKFKEFGSVNDWVIEECFRANSISDSIERTSVEAYQDVETGSLYIFVHSFAHFESNEIKPCGYLFEYFTWCFDLADDSVCNLFRDDLGVILLNHLVRPEEPDLPDDPVIII